MSKKIKITLDPGHGEFGNPYPYTKGYFEGTQMWKLAGFLKTELEKRGFEVVTTRPRIIDNPTVDNRGRLAGQNDSVLMLSLHSNATADITQTSVTGSEVFLSVRGREHKSLAEKLLASVCRVMNHNSRGVKERTLDGNPNNDFFGVIRNAANNGCTCAMLMEHGFHTNPNDAQFLTVDSNLRRLAEAEADVIAKHFGVIIETPPYKLTTADARNILRHVAGIETLTLEQVKLYDFNKDRTITTAHALRILRIVAGLDPDAPSSAPTLKVGDRVMIKEAYAGSAFDAVARSTAMIGAERFITEIRTEKGVNFALRLGMKQGDKSTANTTGFAKARGVEKI
ncbi:MAG: N-acetylmuramoyl-L-alanine amidase [Oscillospiraceae bacterium]|nr:N-acetylmuramoyl-L-alanine amidase [Oscillospiraceae bacterium]